VVAEPVVVVVVVVAVGHRGLEDKAVLVVVVSCLVASGGLGDSCDGYLSGFRSRLWRVLVGCRYLGCGYYWGGFGLGRGLVVLRRMAR